MLYAICYTLYATLRYTLYTIHYTLYTVDQLTPSWQHYSYTVPFVSEWKVFDSDKPDPYVK